MKTSGTITKKNICYKTSAIATYFDGHRDKWDDFYRSEQWAFEKLAGTSKEMGSVLDVGCALGGLGAALSAKYKLKEYMGVDINSQAIEKAKKRLPSFSIPARFECNDITKVNWLGKETFDTVFSLSCADWNIETYKIINACWKSVKPCGNFVVSVRLTQKPGINNIKKSCQPLFRDKNGNIVESANYVVFNWIEFLKILGILEPKPSLIRANGYWGRPSSTAITPYKELVFAVFIVKKASRKDSDKEIMTELSLPMNLFTSL